MKEESRKLGIKDFECNSEFNLQNRIDLFDEFLYDRDVSGLIPYRITSMTGSGSSMEIKNPYTGKCQEVISFVSNDYLGFSKHPKVIEAGINALRKYGAGAGASPLIGGQSIVHEQLEEKIAAFFEKEAAITFTAGFAANSGTLSALIGKNDIAILDMLVHASITDGCTNTNKKYFLHNNLSSLEIVLKDSEKKYKDKFVVVDGVYSQDGDFAPLKEINELIKKYGAFLIVDDAHGVGVFGNKGRGIIEDYGLLDQVDMITGTFSKSFGSVGGYAVANRKLIQYLKYNSRFNIFSAGATPQSVASALAGIQLLEDEPQWRKQLHSNIKYFKDGLCAMGIDHGPTQSAIFPIMVRNEEKTNIAAKMLFENNIYVNPIVYPAVSNKHTRLRMSVLATHTKGQLDKALNLLEYTFNELAIPKITKTNRVDYCHAGYTQMFALP